MFRNLIPALEHRYRVIAPDYPGFGHSDMPDRMTFRYSFARFADLTDTLLTRLGVERYALYVMDYGAPVGYRLAIRHPERVTALVIQNGNAYEEGLSEFWKPIKTYWASGRPADREALRAGTTLAATRSQYVDGVADPSRIDPSAWVYDQALLDRPGNVEIQLDLFYDYRTNLDLYPQFRSSSASDRRRRSSCGAKNDVIFPPEGARAYLQDLPNAELHLLDSGHFALEDQGDEIARLMLSFLDRMLSARLMRSLGAGRLLRPAGLRPDPQQSTGGRGDRRVQGAALRHVHVPGAHDVRADENFALEHEALLLLEVGVPFDCRAGLQADERGLVMARRIDSQNSHRHARGEVAPLAAGLTQRTGASGRCLSCFEHTRAELLPVRSGRRVRSEARGDPFEDLLAQLIVVGHGSTLVVEQRVPRSWSRGGERIFTPQHHENPGARSDDSMLRARGRRVRVPGAELVGPDVTFALEDKELLFLAMPVRGNLAARLHAEE